MKNYFSHFLILLMAGLVSACGLTMPTYQGNGFTIKYPTNWTPNTADQTKLVTISYANPTTYSVDGVIVVQGEQLGSNDATGVIAANELTLKSNPVNQNFSTEKATISGQSTALWKYEQNLNNQKTNFRQAMVIVNGTIYTITATANQNFANVGDLDEAVTSFSIAK